MSLGWHTCVTSWKRLREPPVPVKEDEDLKRKLTADTPSASTPGIQSCLSLPSLSSVSSPQSVRTVKSKPTPKEIEDRKKKVECQLALAWSTTFPSGSDR